MQYKSKVELWMWPGEGAWYFMTLPKTQSAEIKNLFKPISRGFGSIKVRATIGDTTWHTSIFPDSKSGSYLLPVKKQIRQSEKMETGKVYELSLEILN